MLAGAKDLGDLGKSSGNTFDPDWLPAFKQDIDGLILITGDSHATVNEKLGEIEGIFAVGKKDASIHEIIRIVGDVRPGKESGHELFVAYLTYADLLKSDILPQFRLSGRHFEPGSQGG